MRRAALVSSAVLLAVLATPGGGARAADPAEESPLSLTAGDGTGLALVKMDARAVVDEPLAFTELHLTFQNPLDRELEGTFRITLPQGAAVSRFAMKIGEEWQEGEVVELQAARRAYEDFLHRRQDPALLEQAAGNEFSARVYPIPPRGTKELVVSWSQELERADASYVLPLAGLPELGALDVTAYRHPIAAPAAELHKTKYVPSKDFVLAPSPSAATKRGLRDGRFAVVRVSPAEGVPDEPVRSLLVLFDTSASRALGFDAQVKKLEETLAELARENPKLPVTIAAFDQTVEPVFEGAASAAGTAARKLKDRRALGASDLAAALRWAAAHKGATRVLLVSDGVATAGETEGDALIAAVLKLKAAGVERLDAIAVGGIRDEDGLARLVTAGLRSDGVVADGALAAAEIARKLGRATRSGIEVAAERARWVWPSRIDGAQPGDEVLVFCELASEETPLRLTVGGREIDVPAKALGKADAALLERAAMKARIAALLHERDTKADGPAQKEKLRELVVELSTRHRVLTPFTALLVLETEQDYVRFGIDRKALADVLTVKNGRVARTHVHVGTEEVRLPPARDAVATGTKDDTGAEAPPAAAPVAAAEPPSLGEADDAKLMKRADSDPGAGGAAPMEAPMEMAEESRSFARESEAPAPRPARRTRERRPAARRSQDGDDEEDAWTGDSRSPYDGPFADVMELLAKKKIAEAVAKARGWREEAPGDVMALVAYGTALEAAKDLATAARAYGSIIDLFPARADLRRFAGERLESIAAKDRAALALAIDSYGKAVKQRPDHPSGHRLLAFALLKDGQPKRAFEVLEAARRKGGDFPNKEGASEILADDLGLAAAAWMKAEPGRIPEIGTRLREARGNPESGPSLRFVLVWETDANDVDFHIKDGKKGHAYYSNPELKSGGRLYADVTDGYGPECFTIRTPPAKRAYPYTLRAHYYSRGPMGYGMGKLQIVSHDGKGTLTFEERPFVVMVDQAYVDLGVVRN